MPISQWAWRIKSTNQKKHFVYRQNANYHKVHTQTHRHNINAIKYQLHGISIRRAPISVCTDTVSRFCYACLSASWAEKLHSHLCVKQKFDFIVLVLLPVNPQKGMQMACESQQVNFMRWHRLWHFNTLFSIVWNPNTLDSLSLLHATMAGNTLIISFKIS